jgi:hypothetical protein
MDGTTPVSAGVFDVSEGLAIVEADRSVEGFDGAAVTIELDGGSTEPTSTPIMQSESAA